MNPRLIARFLGGLVCVEALFMATSIFWGVLDQDWQTVMHFALAAGITGLVGITLFFWGESTRTLIHPREAIATVAIGWFLVTTIGALPYLIEGSLSHFTDALFESVSGFTTTGASVFGDVESLSRGLLWWRSMTQWLGGMGIIVMFIALFPRLGLGAVHLFRSEMAGPTTERLRPRLRHTSLVLWYVYLSLTVAEAILLTAFGLTPFDAICHSFTTIATGGFSTRNSSIGAFGSFPVEMTVMVFMVLAGINFALYYHLARGKTHTVWKDPELRTYIAIMLGAIAIVTIIIYPDKPDFLTALRHGSFSVITINTETGYATDDFDMYPALAQFLLLGLMVLGGSAGSTAGGIKVARLVVAVRSFFNELLRSFHPSIVRVVRIGENTINDRTVRAVTLYIAVYIGLLFFGSLGMMAFDLDMTSATTSVISCLGGCGPGLGGVGPMQNYGYIAGGGKVLLCVMMLLGRLEVMTLLVFVVPSFWRR